MTVFRASRGLIGDWRVLEASSPPGVLVNIRDPIGWNGFCGRRAAASSEMQQLWRQPLLLIRAYPFNASIPRLMFVHKFKMVLDERCAQDGEPPSPNTNIKAHVNAYAGSAGYVYRIREENQRGSQPPEAIFGEAPAIPPLAPMPFLSASPLSTHCEL